MAEEKQKEENLESSLKAYMQVQYEILSLEVTDKIASSGAWIVSGTVMALCFSLAVIFVSIAGALYLSSLTGSYTKGFGLVAGFYTLISVVFVVFRRRILITPVKDGIIREVLKERA
jgi:hypothetical protein